MSETCLDLLAEMIRFDTVGAWISGRTEVEKPLAEFLEGKASQYGINSQRLSIPGWGFNLLLTVRSREGAPWLLFESHMDTVGTDGMTISPFDPLIKNGKIHGRGACDTKGSGAAMLWALRQYQMDGDGPNNVAVLFTVDEEVRKTGIRQFVDHQLPQLSWRPAAAVVGEPTRMRSIVAHNGVVRWSIRTHGIAAHSSDPDRGRSAISMMTKVIDVLESQYIPRLRAIHPMTGPATCSINMIRGGSFINTIPAECMIELDRRIVPGEDESTVLPEVDTYLQTLRAAHPTLKVSQDEPFLDPALDPEGSKSFSRIVSAVLASMGLDGAPQGVRYGTDASLLGKARIPTIVLGPGDIAQAHTADEWLELGQLEKAIDVYASLMRSDLRRHADAER